MEWAKKKSKEHRLCGMLCNGNAKCMTEGHSSGSDFLLRTWWKRTWGTHLSAHESQGTSSALIIQVPLPWFLSMFWGLHWSPLTWKSSTYLIYLPCSYGVSLKQRSRLYVSDDNPVLVVLSTQKVEAQQPLESQEFWISSIVKTLFKNKKILKENKEDKHVGAHL